MRSFASDNNSGIHSLVLKKIVEVNQGHAIGYGEDQHTKNAEKLLKQHFGKQCEVFFVFNGTGANVLGLKTITSSFQSILCAQTAHLNVDECGAPEAITGCKLQTIPTENGKLTPSKLEPFLHTRGDQHHVQPKVISISQTTELGTVYTLDEIAELSSFAKRHGLLLHMDGARLANAAVSLGVDLHTITKGVDLLSFGGTKNGLMCGEAVIFFENHLSSSFKFIRKQGMHLASKMRFIAAQFEALFTDDLWHKNASNANEMAKKLAAQLSEISEIRLSRPVEANAVFAQIPLHWIEPLQKTYFFYVWDHARCEVRWMTSFDTTDQDIETFVATIKSLL